MARPASAHASETSAWLKELCSGDRAAIGGWCTIGHPLVAEVVSSAGVDWLGLDCQHGLIGADALAGMLQAAAVTRTPTLVRVAQNAPWELGRALDLGANGVIVPMIETVEDARRAAAACRFAGGSRSFARTRASFGVEGYGPAVADESVLCLPMAETSGAVEHIREIAALPGVDGIFVGPSDLSIAMGLPPGSGLDEPVRSAILSVLEACLDAELIPAVYARDVASANAWAAEGFRLIALVNDAATLGAGARDALAAAQPQ